MQNNILTANWNAPKRVRTLITNRIGPNNTDFNLALHVGDNPKQVNNNREILNKFLPNTPNWLNQTHTNKVIDLDIENTITQSFDAAITKKTGIVCVAMTADCIPILVTDKNASFVAAIHAGWRGVQTNIIRNTIDLSKIDPQNIIAYIGPAICGYHFEVEMDLYKTFTESDPNNKQFFKNKTDNKYECDLVGIAKLQLLNLGVLDNNIYLSNICTYCNNDFYYSYRKEKNTGRFASLIWIE